MNICLRMLLLLLVAAACQAAQTCSILGEVLDPAQQGIAGVTIRIDAIPGSSTSPTGAPPANLSVSTTTDSRGRYAKAVNRFDGKYRVTPSRSGYEFKPKTKEVGGACGSASFAGTPPRPKK